jgi:hypothetical protein
MLDSWEAIEAEIVRIRDECVAARHKVDGRKWRATVARCKELRELQKQFKRQKKSKRVDPDHSFAWYYERQQRQQAFHKKNGTLDPRLMDELPEEVSCG